MARIDVQTEDLRLLVSCVTEGSFSAAARTLGITQAVASRRLRRLEAAVGGAVLHRTTRALRPTLMGERWLGAARSIVAELAALERSRGAARTEPEGDVHVSAPILLGQALGATLAGELRRLHPRLRLRLSLSNSKVDLVREGVDVALRVGALPSTTLVAARIATARIGAYARRDRHAFGEHPSALHGATWLGHPGDVVLRATGPAGERWSATIAPVFTSDDRIVLRDAVRAGLGIALLPTFFGDAEPLVRRIVPDWSFGRVPLHGVWLPEARSDPRVRAVVDVVSRWGAAQRW
jgi:DNA-binding transcriptional LysR family regulator